MPSLRKAVERLFETDFLFDRDHRTWRSIVADVDSGMPLPVDVDQVLGFSSVVAAIEEVVEEAAAAAKEERDALTATTSSATGIAAATAAASRSAVIAAVGRRGGVDASTVVEVVEDDAGIVCLRRVHPLRAIENPELRTIFAKPIHFDATDDMVQAFFSRWGTVTRVERRSYLAGAAGAERARPSVFVTFASVDEAERCVAARPSYATCADVDPLGSLFVPKLTVASKAAHEDAQSALVQRSTAMQLQKALVGAAAPAASSAASPSAAAVVVKDDEVRKSLPVGCTCKVWGLPSSTAATEEADAAGAEAVALGNRIKAKLGNLALNRPELRKQLGLVHVATPKPAGSSNSSTSQRIAYVECKSPEVARILLEAYATVAAKAPTEGFAAGLVAVVPRLTLLDDAEEERAFAQLYPRLVADAVRKKVQSNQKKPQHRGGGSASFAAPTSFAAQQPRRPQPSPPCD